MYDLYKIYKRYKSNYKNYISVILNVYKKNNNINVILTDGSRYEWDYKKIRFYTLLPRNLKNKEFINNYNNNSDYIMVKFNKEYIKLYGVNEGNGDISCVFINNDYKFLNPENEFIIDIGANIGDSSIYFALNNAKKVIALEPYPYSYNFALKNININNLNDKIILLNAGYGEDSEIKVDENKITNAATDLVQSNKGKSIKIYSLKTLINSYGLDNDLLLKMDCEGCEYNLLNEDCDILKKFKRIQLEYHHGYNKLINKLRENNFNVKYTEPRKSYNKQYKRTMNIGYIYAERL